MPLCARIARACFCLFKCSSSPMVNNVKWTVFPSAFNWWLQIIVLLIYIFFYLNFDCILKCNFDSVVAGRLIFGKGIFLLLLWFTGCSYILYILYDFTIYNIAKLIIFLSSQHFPSSDFCYLSIILFLHQRANSFHCNSFLFACCFILYLIVYLFLTFIYLSWETLSWVYN